ncbi:MAG: ROK family protein [Bacteroidales bacterium]|nr:ROK family protein [Bacteroidales bacterium]
MAASFLNENTRNALAKREILRQCILHDRQSIASLNAGMAVSIPTVTKLVGELIDDGFLQDEGKIGTTGGRRPCIYGLNPQAGYFVGADIGRHHFNLAITDFKGTILHYIPDIPFVLESSEQSFRDICQLIREQVRIFGIPWKKVLSVGVSLSGRVNPEKGYSLTWVVSEDIPLKDIFQRELDVPVGIENDSRAMTYGEYVYLGPAGDKDMICINLSWGLGMGMILDGNLYYGKSGFSGEIGHFPFNHKDIMCRCGKIGCLETEASGSALHRMIVEKLREGRHSSLSDIFRKNGDIELKDILNAIRTGDVLAIECIGEIGETLGRAIAGIINIFNPGMVVIGGRLVVGKDYLRLPIKTAINRLSLSRVSADTKIRLSELGEEAAAFGDCMLSRKKLLGI